MTRSVYKKVGIASMIMMGSVFLSRVIGLFREMVIAYAGGAGAAVDAYQVAFVLPEILNHIVASGFLSVTFIPIFSRYLSEGQEEEGWRIFSIILNGFGSVLIVLIAVGVLFAPQLVSLIAPGIKDPSVTAAAVRMTRIIIPAQFFFFAGGLFMAVQFAKEAFSLPALAPLLYNVGIIAGGILLGPYIGMEGFAWGALGGAFVGNFALQYRGAKRVGMRYHATVDFRHPDLKHYVRLTLPLMLGLTMTFSTEFFLKFFGSFLPRGSIAALNYGLRVMLILVGLFGQAVGVASFPFMARFAVENKIAEMNALLNRMLRYLALVIPLSALVIVLRREIVTMLFQRGRFDEAATALTANALLFLLTGAFAFAAQTIVVRGYYAMQNTLFPAVFGTLAVLASIPLYLAGMHLMGVGGVAWAISASAVIQAALLYAAWNRKTRNPDSFKVYALYARMALLAAAVGLALEWMKRRVFGINSVDTFLENLMVCGGVTLLFGGLLLAAGHLFKMHEISEFLYRLRERIKRK